jgi:HSP20 family protein
LFLGDTLDTGRIKADYDGGVLTLRIPIAEQAKPRKIEIGGPATRREINA